MIEMDTETMEPMEGVAQSKEPPTGRSSRRNPLALMVLCTLWEQPTHPYQLVQILKGRQKDKSARLNYGSLYTVIAGLEKHDLIEAVEVTKVGNLPPRTTYRVTKAGIAELNDWLSQLIASPEPEIPQFMTALSLLPALPVDTAARLLRQRAGSLERTLELMDAQRQQSARMIPELLFIEALYQAAMIRAELAFTNQLVDDIESGRLSGVQSWRMIQKSLEDGRPNYGASVAAFAKEGYPVEQYE